MLRVPTSQALSLCTHLLAPVVQSATVRQAFLVLDKDRSGTITGHELRRVPQI